MIIRHLNIIISGEIRNIGFTLQVMRIADKFHINGYAAYLDSNTVKIEAEGKEKDLIDFVDWFRHDDQGSRISEIEVKPGSLIGFNEFSIAGNKLNNLNNTNN